MFLCKHCGKEFTFGRGLGGHTFRVHTEKGKAASKKGCELAALANKGNKHGLGYKHSVETKEYLSDTRIKHLHKRKFFSKPEIYNGVHLDSSYESAVARSLDENKIRWIRPKSLRYYDGIQFRRYVPDFYLIDYDVYLDPKNDWLIKKDKQKISLASEQNNVTVLILSKDQLTWHKISERLNTSL